MACCEHGPGYATPQDAINGPREKLVYLPAVVPDHSRPDYLVTVDVDPASSTYGQVIHRLHFPHKGDELHHTGWNACSSCYGDKGAVRKLLILPALVSGRVYGVDTATDPRVPVLYKTVEPEDIVAKTGLKFLHTSHCLGSGEIMISTLGDKDLNGHGSFLLLDQELNIKGKWSEEHSKYGYDFWYQPKHNVMISTAWGSPKAILGGFNPAEVAEKYGSSLYVWDWKERKLVQEIELGDQGLLPLEVRFLHDPSKEEGFVGAALSSNVISFRKDPADKARWAAKTAIKQEWTQVEGWILPAVPPLISDILISLDDKFIYYSNWLRGDINQYDISDPENPRLVGRVWVGGLIRQGGGLKVTGGLPEGVTEAPTVPKVKGHELRGGPQMIQLSLDGKRLYVTNSLFGPWDKQFYPELHEKGSHLLLIDVDNVKGGLTINPDFFVDFGAEPGGPVLAHEVRYPGGDCSSDIWL